MIMQDKHEYVLYKTNEPTQTPKVNPLMITSLHDDIQVFQSSSMNFPVVDPAKY